MVEASIQKVPNIRQLVKDDLVSPGIVVWRLEETLARQQGGRLTLFPGVSEAVGRFSGLYTQVVVSDGYFGEELERVIGELRLRPAISQFVGVRLDGAVRQLYDQAVREVGLKDRCVVVEGTLEGLMVANEKGFRSIGIAGDPVSFRMARLIADKAVRGCQELSVGLINEVLLRPARRLRW